MPPSCSGIPIKSRFAIQRTPRQGLIPWRLVTHGPEIISRVATYGSTVRELYRVTNNCGVTKIRSNIASDASYIYWLAASGSGLGLMRLSVNANVGDAPELMHSLIHGEGIGSSFVAVTSSRVYVIYTDGSGDRLGYVDKSTEALITFGDFGAFY